MTCTILGMKKPPKKPPPAKGDLDQIAYRLRLARVARGLTPAELCRATGIAPNTYSQWESAKSRPQIDAARTLVRTLGLSLDWIYEGSMVGLPFDVALKLRQLQDRSAAGEDIEASPIAPAKTA